MFPKNHFEIFFNRICDSIGFVSFLGDGFLRLGIFLWDENDENPPFFVGTNPPLDGRIYTDQAWCQSGGRQEVLPSVGLAFSSRQKPQQLGAPKGRGERGGVKGETGGH